MPRLNDRTYRRMLVRRCGCWFDIRRWTILGLATGTSHVLAVRSGGAHFSFAPPLRSCALGTSRHVAPTFEGFGLGPSLLMVRGMFRRFRVLRGPTSLAFCLGDADRDRRQGQKVE